MKGCCVFPSLGGEKMRSSVPDLFWERTGSKHCCFSTRGQDGGGRVSHSPLSFTKPDLPASFHPAVAESMLRHRLSLHPALGFEVLEGAQWACGLAGVPAGGTVFAQFCSWLSSIPFQPLTSAGHRRGPKRTPRKSTKRTWRKIHPCRCCAINVLNAQVKFRGPPTCHPGWFSYPPTRFQHARPCACQ